MKFKVGDKVTNISKAFSSFEQNEVWTVVAQHPMWDDAVVGVTALGRAQSLAEEHLMLYQDPVKVAGWVNVYPDRVGCVYETQQVADSNQGHNRIACVYVTGTEGNEP